MINEYIARGLVAIATVTSLAGLDGCKHSPRNHSFSQVHAQQSAIEPNENHTRNYKASIMVRNPDGSFYKSTKEFSPDGRLIKEYREYPHNQ